MQDKVKFRKVGRQNQWWANKSYKENIGKIEAELLALGFAFLPPTLSVLTTAARAAVMLKMPFEAQYRPKDGHD